MKLETIAVGLAAGHVLAHGHRLGEGRPMLKKGRLLSEDDCAALAATGATHVVVARLDPDDLPEDEAAREVALAIAGPHVTLSPATTGRANGTAAARGVLVVSRDRVDRLNLVDEAITLATLPPYAIVEPGALVMTVKIIPFAVPRARVIAACAAANEGAHGASNAPLVSIAPLVSKRAGLILTTLPGTREEQLLHGAKAQHLRMAYLGGAVSSEVRVPHDVPHVAAAITRMIDAHVDLVLVLGASAIVDRDDVIPSAIRAAGGHVDHLGMPVDPGNLALLAHLGSVPVVGVPGCARSLRPSGFDWILERLAANLTISRDDIMRMGAGGLLAEVPTRPSPREIPSNPAPPRVGAVLLAAGLSRRMGTNKLLESIDGVPMIARAADALLASRADPVVVVTGHQSDAVRAALQGRPLRFVQNPAYEEGLGASLRAGIEALDALAPPVDAALVALGDMPWIRPEHVNALIAAFDPSGPATICVPVYDGAPGPLRGPLPHAPVHDGAPGPLRGPLPHAPVYDGAPGPLRGPLPQAPGHDRKRGHPVLWSRRHFPEMKKLQGDVGARGLMERHADNVLAVPIDDDAIHRDVDTPDMLHK